MTCTCASYHTLCNLANYYIAKTATSPTIIAETVFATLGRGVVRDQVYFHFVTYVYILVHNRFEYLHPVGIFRTAEISNAYI